MVGGASQRPRDDGSAERPCRRQRYLAARECGPHCAPAVDVRGRVLTRGMIARLTSRPKAASGVARGGNCYTLLPRAPASFPKQDWAPGHR
jgi:hypothetical protein